MKQQEKIIIISSICVLLSFFLGYVYASRDFQKKLHNISDAPIYIDVKTNTKGITVKELPENVFFRVDGDLMQSGSIELKK